MLWLMGLPKPYHPVFEVERFRSASIDKFWVSVRLLTTEPGLRVVNELEALHAESITTIDEAP